MAPKFDPWGDILNPKGAKRARPRMNPRVQEPTLRGFGAFLETPMADMAQNLENDRFRDSYPKYRYAKIFKLVEHDLDGEN